MKRGMTGGTYRGPLGAQRQRRTIRFMQFLLIAIAAGLLFFAGHSYGRVSGFEDGQRAGAVDAPREPSLAQPLVLTLLGLGLIGGAFALNAGGGVRLLTPARLDDMEKAAAPKPAPANPLGGEPTDEATTPAEAQRR